MRILKGLQIDNPEELIAQPSPPPPDPKMMELQLKDKIATGKHELDQIKEQREGIKTHIEMLKAQLKQKEYEMTLQESDDRQREMTAKAHKDQQEANVKDRMATVAEDKVGVERARLELMAKQQQHDNSVKSD